ncbi:hypothetical protein [Janibacter cremeus]|uniref:Uncharacterized protein n=1 Tax=Janibacter cremeus TaxID=1285192 RepID=A0A852VPR8_9MICO|nr:hypothetical protein [Janibacter cremeus]NYF99027.1 hypothetical protein [Janibacter cremeus]
MSADRDRVLLELPLPLGSAAVRLDALSLAVAIEDGCGVVLPDRLITADHLRNRESIEAVLDSLAE